MPTRRPLHRTSNASTSLRRLVTPALLLPGLLLLGPGACNQDREHEMNPPPPAPAARPAAPAPAAPGRTEERTQRMGQPDATGGARPTPAPLAPAAPPGPAPLAHPGPIEPAPLAPAAPPSATGGRDADLGAPRPVPATGPSGDASPAAPGATPPPAPLAPTTLPGAAPLANPGPPEPAPLAPAVEPARHSPKPAPTTGPSDASGSSAPAPAPETRPAATTFTGTLHARPATGPAGAHAAAGAPGTAGTGWVLAGDGAVGGLDVDVSAVAADARALDGKRVTVSGRLKPVEVPGRGKTQVLVADQLTAAPLPELNK